jgi:hypothetical protein
MDALRARLTALLPDLENGRRIHAEWVDYWQKPDAEQGAKEWVGDADFHRRLVAKYDERIAAIQQAIECLATPPPSDALTEMTAAFEQARGMLRTALSDCGTLMDRATAAEAKLAALSSDALTKAVEAVIVEMRASVERADDHSGNQVLAWADELAASIATARALTPQQ